MKIYRNYKDYWIFLLSSLLLLSIAYFDYFTGELGFFIFYFIPIILLSWNMGRWFGVGMSVASSTCWFLSDYYCGYRYGNLAVAVWDTLVIRGGAFIIAAIAVSKLHESIEKQRKMGIELGIAMSHLKQLKRILPVCPGCMERNKGGCYLEQVEAYINSNSRTKPSPGAIPECMAKNHPELVKEVQKGLED